MYYFDVHIQSCKNEAKKKKINIIIKRTFTSLDNEIFNNLYKTLVCPHLGGVW